MFYLVVASANTLNIFLTLPILCDMCRLEPKGSIL